MKNLIKLVLLSVTAATMPFAPLSVRADKLFVGNDWGTEIWVYDTAVGASSRAVLRDATGGANGMTFDTNGNLFVSDGRTRIVMFPPEGERSTFTTLDSTGGGLAFDSHGNLFVPFQWASKIEKISPDGSERSVIASDLGAPVALAFDRYGQLFAADQKTGDVYKIAPDGTLSTFASGLGRPVGITFDKDGTLFVGSPTDHAIYQFTTNGTRSVFATGIQACTLAFDSLGNLFVATGGDGSVFKFTKKPSGLSHDAELFDTDLGHDYFMAIAPVLARGETVTSQSHPGSGATTQFGGIELQPVQMVAGVVHRPDGQPAAGVRVQLVGSSGQPRAPQMTDANGRFAIPFPTEAARSSSPAYCLLVRDVEHNLAVAQDIDEDTGSLDLRLAPGMTLAGRAEINGKPIANAAAALVFRNGDSSMLLQGLAVGTNVPGHFEIPALPRGRQYGLRVSAPGYGQASVNAVEFGDDAGRIELSPVELKPANLKIAGQVLDADDNPVAGARIYLSGEGQPSGRATSDEQGRFSFDHLCEGSVSLRASTRTVSGDVSAEGGDTNVVLKLGGRSNYSSGVISRKLKGVVTGPDGQPVADAQVVVFPETSSQAKTGADGAYNLTWSLQQWQLQQGGDPWVVVRDTARNLAAAETIIEGVANVDVRLKPGIDVTGRVEDVGGAALANAEINLYLMACRSGSHLSEQPVRTDFQGHFEIKDLPFGPEYWVYASAKGYGQRQEKLEADGSTNRVELPPFALRLADKTIAGQVLDAQEQPVSGVQVSLSGEDQPNGNITTDTKGYFSFKVCEGQIQLFAYASGAFANATADAGDTNIVIQLRSNGGMSVRSTPKRPSLKGKPLPDLATVGLAADVAPAGKPLLLCLLDAEQRPSRRSVRLLADQQAALAQKGVTLLAIQAAVASAETLQAWTNSSPLPFPLGRVAEKSPATRWATGVESLPWLILRDANGNVAAEGFALDELDVKLEALNK